MNHPSDPPTERELKAAAGLLEDELDRLVDEYSRISAQDPAVGVQPSLANYLVRSTEPPILAALLAAAIARLA
ncbi:hypothetical protein [Amycolatopsis magusensis]|uniref:Uncharacterized protein n=1 Tax=Amycolatopsis magusensis TaxID=882444 RepID=A0ABS4PPZ3_9PSEU|nr:hypothetical protein [Amycolatopsis magusensis]MBP2181485.1 hypothetical protein [Amycolatopsis magusensis]MDI5977996.1 hypothetical protein [Amycolatopsis magusensis]UJW32284.1 hypothetical protein L3Q67_00375 [Saccharothrix sp. AJ9571]